MRLRHLISVVGMLGLIVCSCQKSKSKASLPDEEAVTRDATEESSDANKAPQTAEPVRCSDLNIPTYNSLIKDLSALRCDSCHNETFAWKGMLILTQYDAWKTYEKPIRNRISIISSPLLWSRETRNSFLHGLIEAYPGRMRTVGI